MIKHAIVNLVILWIGCTVAAPKNLATRNTEGYVIDGVTGEVVDINKIISNVESILKLNPQLPRLSRDQILRFLKNITAEDSHKLNVGVTGKPKQITSTSKPKDSTIMVVLPYSAANTEANKMSELYTKPPIVTFVTPRPENDELEIINDEGVILNSKEFKNHRYSVREINNPENNFKDSSKYWNEQTKKVMSDLTNDASETTFKQMPSSSTQMFNDNLENIPLKLATKYENVAEQDSSKDFLNTVNGVYVDEPVNNFKNLNNQYLPLKQASQETMHPPSVASAFVEFKPLPASMTPTMQPISKEVQEILSNFGIIDSLNEPKPLSIKMEDNEEQIKDMQVDPNMFPADMTSMLTDMGLTGRRDRMMDQNNDSHLHDDPNSFQKMVDSMLNDLKKRESEEQLSLTTPTTTTQLKEGPDPIQKIEEPRTSDVKRRESEEQSTLTTQITIPTEESTLPDTTTSPDPVEEEDSKSSSANDNPNIADLENSFGASPADDDPSEAELPPPRRNGFYYMLDWNSFLEVGEGERKVNIRFDPKLGDPQRFLNVNLKVTNSNK